MRWNGRRGVAVPVGLLVATVVLAGCGSPGPSGPGAASAGPPTASASGPASGTATASTSPATGGATGTATATALPGVGYDRGPAAGQALTVIGLPVGRSIPLQAAPGPGQRVLTTVTTQVKRVVAVGQARLVGSGGSAGSAATVWVEATVGGVTGWIEGAHLAAPGATTDLTAEVIDKLGYRPVDETMLDLGMHVARAYASTEPPSTITVVVTPTVGDLGEITVDVVGLGDDSVAGQRLHVFGTPGQESFTLKSVEATPFCYRGVSASGLCV